MEVEEERCRLQWDDYASDLSLSLWKLRDLPDLCDVTLATNEGTVTAHRIILSACSLQLRDMIMKSMQGGNNKQDLVIYLRGVRHCDLLDLVKFIYFGTVSVAKEDLNSFLALAKDLGVKGLDKHWSPSEGAPGEQMVVDEDWFSVRDKPEKTCPSAKRRLEDTAVEVVGPKSSPSPTKRRRRRSPPPRYSQVFNTGANIQTSSPQYRPSDEPEQVPQYEVVTIEDDADESGNCCQKSVEIEDPVQTPPSKTEEIDPSAANDDYQVPTSLDDKIKCGVPASDFFKDTELGVDQVWVYWTYDPSLTKMLTTNQKNMKSHFGYCKICGQTANLIPKYCKRHLKLSHKIQLQ